jgi:hypothetical protein
MADIRENALVVLHPFSDYTKGEIITDPTTILAIRQNGQMAFVVSTQIIVPQQNAPAAKAVD